MDGCKRKHPRLHHHANMRTSPPSKLHMSPENPFSPAPRSHHHLHTTTSILLTCVITSSTPPPSRKCGNRGCRGLKKAMEFDLQMQGEDCLRSGGKEVKDINELPWKGGSEANPDYECLRAELRKMAPPNGRAVLLFWAKCGCPVAKLEGWGPKRSRRHKNSVRVQALAGEYDILQDSYYEWRRRSSLIFSDGTAVGISSLCPSFWHLIWVDSGCVCQGPLAAMEATDLLPIP
ncbi:unnamed protein product [Ilex paraguariensis]|uniref:Uncharacterized protein n=1 Tax=Ilex paraguariensis TaxID=185542 RepID=A0ABC8TW05_9AQUA